MEDFIEQWKSSHNTLMEHSLSEVCNYHKKKLEAVNNTWRGWAASYLTFSTNPFIRAVNATAKTVVPGYGKIANAQEALVTDIVESSSSCLDHSYGFWEYASDAEKKRKAKSEAFFHDLFKEGQYKSLPNLVIDDSMPPSTQLNKYFYGETLKKIPLKNISKPLMSGTFLDKSCICIVYKAEIGNETTYGGYVLYQDIESSYIWKLDKLENLPENIFKITFQSKIIEGGLESYYKAKYNCLRTLIRTGKAIYKGRDKKLEEMTAKVRLATEEEIQTLKDKQFSN